MAVREDSRPFLKKNRQGMAITIELYELKNICKDMAELGAASYAKMVNPGKDRMSQREAYREFQPVRVRRWVESGLVSCSRSGCAANSRMLYSRAELIAADKSERLDSIINKLKG